MALSADFRLRVPRDPADTVGEVRRYLEGGGYRVEGSERLVAVRGTGLRRFWSQKVEDWPTRLEVRPVGLTGGGTGLLLHYQVRTSLRLVGSLEQAILEAEAALIQQHLETGRAPTLSAAVAPVRRPVAVAVGVNALLAVLVVCLVGALAGQPPLLVMMVALAVALLNSLTISAFADLLVDGARRLPRVRDDRPSPSEAVPETPPVP